MATEDSLAKAKQAAMERARNRLLEEEAQNESAPLDPASVSERAATPEELAAYEAAIAASRLADSGRVEAVGNSVAQPDLLGTEPDDSNTDEALLRAGARLGARSSDSSPEAASALDAFNSVMDGTADPMSDARQEMADKMAGPGGTGQDGPRADYDGTGRSAPSQDDIGTVFRVNLDRDMATVVDSEQRKLGRGEVVVSPEGNMLWKNDDGTLSILHAESGKVVTIANPSGSPLDIAEFYGAEADDDELAEGEEIVINHDEDEAEDGGDPSGDNISIEEKMAAAERFQREFGIDPNTGGAVGAETGGDGRTDPASYTTVDTGGRDVNAAELLRGGGDPLAPGGNDGEVDADGLDVVTSQDEIINYGPDATPAATGDGPYLDDDITADHTGSGPVVELPIPGETDGALNTVEEVHTMENDLGPRGDVNDDSITKFDPDAAVDDLFDFD